MTRLPAIVPGKGDTTKIWMGKVTAAPREKGPPHTHLEAETAAYVLKGHVRVYFEEWIEAGLGDFREPRFQDVAAARVRSDRDVDGLALGESGGAGAGDGNAGGQRRRKVVQSLRVACEPQKRGLVRIVDVAATCRCAATAQCPAG